MSEHKCLKSELDLEKELEQKYLTKREKLAAMAMQGLVSNGPVNPELDAHLAVECADALIKELEK